MVQTGPCGEPAALLPLERGAQTWAALDQGTAEGQTQLSVAAPSGKCRLECRSFGTALVRSTADCGPFRIFVDVAKIAYFPYPIWIGRLHTGAVVGEIRTFQPR